MNLYVTLPPNFDELLEELRLKGLKTTETPKGELLIKYDSTTGDGKVNGQPFKFKDGTQEYAVFAQLYGRVGKKLKKADVLVAAGFYQDYEEADPARRASETETINEIAKNIRRKTGLDTKQLVLNNGNLTLVAKKGP